MPFWYHIPVPAIPESSRQAVRLLKGLVKDAEEIHAGTPVAILETPDGRFAVLANGDGLIREMVVSRRGGVADGNPDGNSEC